MRLVGSIEVGRASRAEVLRRTTKRVGDGQTRDDLIFLPRRQSAYVCEMLRFQPSDLFIFPYFSATTHKTCRTIGPVWHR
jgi:hypothetical protein